MGFVMDGLETEAYDRQYSDRQLLSRIAAYFRPWRGRMAAVGAVLALASLSEFAAQVVVSKSLDAVSRAKVAAAGAGAANAAGASDGSIVFLIAAAVIGFGSIEWLFNYLRYVLSSKVVGDTIFRLRSEAFSKSVRHDLSFYDEHSSGKVVSRITTDTEDFANVIGLVVDFLSQIVLVSVFLAYLISLSPRLTLLLVAMAPVAMGVALAFRRIARFVTSNAKRVTAEVNAEIQESVAGIGVAKGFRRERSLWGSFKTENALAYRFGLRRGVVLQLIFPIVSLAAGVGNGIIAFAGGMAARGGALSMGEWFIFMQAVGFFWWPMLNIASFWSQLQDGLAAAERVFSLIDRESRVRQTGDFAPGRIEGEIEFRGLGFSYSEKETVLEDFSLKVAAGEKLAIVGRTGAGKSTIAKLISRAYEFQSGSLLVDGRDIRSYSLDALRGAIGLVSQDPFLFSGTVADNIRYGLPGAPDSRIEEAARSLGRGDWVDDLPSGLATETGHRGSSLSMGQRQLVVLARVLLRDPRIFILDEATSSVDPFTEAQIQEGLEAVMSGRTAIVIAHRLSTVKSADRIVVLDKGRILEEGSHESLLDRGGNYAELYRSYFRHQSLEYIETAPAAAGA
jgi:ABC-type multidrug transport system fused ATPase/permease subunit